MYSSSSQTMLEVYCASDAESCVVYASIMFAGLWLASLMSNGMMYDVWD